MRPVTGCPYPRSPLASIVLALIVLSIAPHASVADPAWHRIGITARSEASMVYDPLGDRMLVYGGFDGTNVLGDLWALEPGAGVPEWTPLTLVGVGPALRGHVAIMDTVRNRLHLLGGIDQFGDRRGHFHLSLDGDPTWLWPPCQNGPNFARYASAGTYDPVGDRIIMFGGESQNGLTNDLWELDLATCTGTYLSPSGTAPDPRMGHSAIYDPVRHRVVVFGGVDEFGYSLDDVHALDLSTLTWTEIVTTRSPVVGLGLTEHVAVYLPNFDGMLVSGGRTAGGSDFGATMRLPLGGPPEWQASVIAHIPPERERELAAAAYDASRNRVVLFGGFDDGVYFADAWMHEDTPPAIAAGPALDSVVPLWDPYGPPPRMQQASLFDPVRGGALECGGRAGDAALGDVRAFRPFEGPSMEFSEPYASRWGHVGVYDSIRDRVILQGGLIGGWGYFFVNSVDAYRLSAPAGWESIVPVGPSPPQRQKHAAIYDPVGDRIVMFGGTNDTYHWPTSLALGDVWELSLGSTPTWTALTPTGPPPSPRYGHTATYDPVDHRAVIIGGRDASGTALNDVWALDLASTSWVPITPVGALPPGREMHAATYVPNEHAVLCFGGRTQSANSNELWKLTLGPGSEWSQILVPGGPTPRFGASAVYDPDHARLIVGGGGNNIGSYTWGFADVWVLEGLVLDTPRQEASSIRVSAVAPSPSRFGSRVTFELPRETEVRATVYDPAGRRVRALTASRFDAGRHALAWDGADAGGTPVPAGLYVVRLEIGDETFARKALIVR